jgi:18S rRNA (guanine1575-N7)-methyltransferase
MMEIQTKMANRAIELLGLPADRSSYILDIGCGSGLSGEALSEAGHTWIGIDIAPAMLGVAAEREVPGDLLCSDAGQGLNFRPGTFDGAISISVLQWLCNADRKEHVPQKRLRSFFRSLHQCLTRGARAIFQFYPESPHQVTMITQAAMRVGFSGGVVIDYPNSKKAKKYFLTLFAGEASEFSAPRALGVETAEAESSRSVMFSRPEDDPKHRFRSRRSKTRKGIKTHAWIVAKKDRMRKQGRTVAKNSKYTGRRRNPKF